MIWLGLGFLLFTGAVTVTWKMFATTIETITGNTGSLDSESAAETVTHSAFDESGTLNAGSTPAGTKTANFILTLTTGAATIDLTNLSGLNGAVVTGLALKIQIIRIKNLGANAMTFVAGASNGYVLASTIVVPPSGVAMIYGAGGMAAVGASTKNIDVSGTGSQTAEITIIFG